MKSSSKEKTSTTPLTVLAAIALTLVIIGAAYGLYLLSSLTYELKQLSAKMDKLSTLETVAGDMHKLTQKLSLIDQANQRITKMEGYVSYIPGLSKTGNRALEESVKMNGRLEVTNERLRQTDLCLRGTVGQLTDVVEGLQVMPIELRRAGGSIEQMSNQFSALGDMRNILARTSTSLDKTSEGITKVSGDFEEMKLLLQDMSGQFAVLPEIKSSLDQTSATITTAMGALEPLSKELPKFSSSMDEMNRTTKEMAQGMKKAPKQGALSIGILTAAQLLAH